MRSSDWSSDVCSSDLENAIGAEVTQVDVGRAVGAVRDILVGVGRELRQPDEHPFDRRRDLIEELFFADDGDRTVAFEIGAGESSSGNDNCFAITRRRNNGRRYVSGVTRRREKTGG